MNFISAKVRQENQAPVAASSLEAGSSEDEVGLDGSSRRSLVVAVASYDSRKRMERLRLEHAWVADASAQAPSYLDVCRLVYPEIRAFLESIEMGGPSPVAFVLTFLGVGHFMCRVGRRFWAVAAWQYWLFVQVCCGVWTDESVAGYDVLGTLRTFSTAADFGSDASVVLAIIVSTRAILLQLLPNGTLLSLLVMATAGTPLFVSSAELRSQLPGLLVWDPVAEATEAECRLSYARSQGFLVADYLWIVRLNAFIMVVTESRLSVFLFSVAIVVISSLLLLRTKTSYLCIIPLVAFVLTFVFVSSFFKYDISDADPPLTV